MSQRLLQAGHQVTMICGAYDVSDLSANLSSNITEFDVDGIQVIRVPLLYGNRMDFLHRILAFGRFARTAGKIACTCDADLIFATSPPLSVGIPGMKASKRLGVPFVFEVRDRWPEGAIVMGAIKNPLLIRYLCGLEKKIYRAADRVIALSPGAQEGIASTGYPAEKIAMIPNASDIDLFKPASGIISDPRFGQPEDFRLVFTGAHGYTNGLDAVLDAALVLKRRKEHSIRFVFIGEGILREQLMSRSRREELHHMISWIPSIPKEELATIIPRMDVGMMLLKNIPSLYYGTSPNKFFDYIASGLPVLNNYPGWIAEMIQQYRCGMVVPPDDPAAFADAVVWMRDHSDNLKNMGVRARELAENKFSRDKLAAQFVGTLEAAQRSY
jgi:glycosyltransferase involved in cell wall biosynthesis